MTVKNWLKKDNFVDTDKKVREVATCEDGLVLSIQASSSHYCSPKKDRAKEYTAVEVMVISGVVPDELKKYETGGVHGWVPMEVLEDVVARHGGIENVY